jgi:hypothetical protein
MIEKEGFSVKRTEEDMFALLVEHANSQMTVKQFCEQKGLSVSMYYYWQKKYRTGHNGGDLQPGRFTVVELGERAEVSPIAGLFAEYKGIRFYKEPSVDFLKQLIN